LLDRMVDHISRDLDASPISDCMTVTLGDYIDRGPDSRGVLDRLVRNPFPTDFIALKGKSTKRCSRCFSTIPPLPSIGGD
jgi:serine/threonine protein phosphatase 1